MWYKIEKTLKDFDSLFNESKTIHTVNGREEKHEDYNFLVSMRHIHSDKPKELKIFGHDIYEWGRK